MMQSSVTGRWFAGQFQWIKCGLLFLGMTKNYMDRQVTGVLKGMLQHEFVWSEIDYSNLVFAFQAAYAIGMLAVGRRTLRYWIALAEATRSHRA